MLQNSPKEKKHGSSLIRVTQKPQTQRGCIAFHFCCSARAVRDKSALLYCHCFSFFSGVFFLWGGARHPTRAGKGFQEPLQPLLELSLEPRGILSTSCSQCVEHEDERLGPAIQLCFIII